MDIKLKQNLGRIIRTLEGQGMKPTQIAHAIGYTTTRQLYNSIEGQSMLSTKAVKGLIQNLNVNPLYLFLGKGDMFLADETEIETLRRENREWIQKHNEALKTIMELNETIKTLEKRNADLIDLSSAAIKYYQGQNIIESIKDSNMNAEPFITMADVERVLGKELKPKVKISDNPAKREKK